MNENVEDQHDINNLRFCPIGLLEMGVRFSLVTFKVGFTSAVDYSSGQVKLNAASKRMANRISKIQNEVKLHRKTIAQLLTDEKDETARIRAESLFHEMNQIRAMEVLTMQVRKYVYFANLTLSVTYWRHVPN